MSYQGLLVLMFASEEKKSLYPCTKGNQFVFWSLLSQEAAILEVGTKIKELCAQLFKARSS